MTDPNPWLTSQRSGSNLADVLERVLDKGLVIAGDIKICLLDIELLTIKLRLLVASVDRAKAMGIDWWEYDPSLSSRHQRQLTADAERVQLGAAEGEGAKEVPS
jgi:Gas vesicle protein